MTVPLDGFVQMTIEVNMQNDNQANMVVHAAYDNLPSTSNQSLIDLVDVWRSAWDGPLQNAMHDSCSITGVDIHVRDLVNDQWDSVGFLPYAIAGLVTGDPFPAMAAGLAAIFTNDSRVTGRKYIPGVPESFGNIEGQLNSTAVNAYLNFIQALFANYTGAEGEYTPGVWSKVNDLLYPVTAIYDVATTYGTQRRRRAGVGI